MAVLLRQWRGTSVLDNYVNVNRTIGRLCGFETQCATGSADWCCRKPRANVGSCLGGAQRKVNDEAKRDLDCSNQCRVVVHAVR
jgi:hypothetical protein